jgi:Uma2 family endonuclease
MGYAAVRTGMSEQEYLAFERASAEKHEYANGAIFAISSGTGEHSAIAANIISEARSALFGRGCRVHTSDMRVNVASAGRYVYPDASIVCARPEYTDDSRDTLVNPLVIVEVLSDSSEAYDRGDKFAQYQTIASVAEYVLASQKKPRIEVFTRQADGSWLLRVYGPGDRAVLSSVECVIDVDRVYTDVFETVAAGEVPAGEV